MTKQIPDLLNDYTDSHVSLPETPFPTAARTKELTMKKIKSSRRRSLGRFPRTAVIAAATISLLTLSVAAVGFTFWDRARNDLGITDQNIPEYTEYTSQSLESFGVTITDTPSIPESLSSVESTESAQTTILNDALTKYYVEDANITLISTLCTGNKLTTYLAISPVSEAMAEATLDENQGLYTFAYWSDNIREADNGSSDSTQIEYDAETQTALIRLDATCDVLAEISEVTLDVLWESQQNQEVDRKYYGAVRVPITQSSSLHTTTNIPLENAFLSGLSGTLASLEVYAGYVTATVEIPSFYEACEILGDNAHYIIGDAYWNYFNALNGQSLDENFTELDAYVAYKRAWSVTLSTFSTDMRLVFQDGTSIVVMEQDSMYAGWSPVITDSDDDTLTDEMTQTTMTEKYDLSTPLDLSQIKAIVIGGVEYPLEVS